MRNNHRYTVLAAALISCSSAIAADNFSYVGTVVLPPPTTASASFTTLDGLTNGLSTSGLKATFSGYDGTQITAANINFTGLPMSTTFPNTGFTGTGAQLNFRVPSIGIDETFQGATRDDSVDLLKEYLKKNAGQIYNKLAQVSPGNPIAGNPNSLMSRMAASAFYSAFEPVSWNKQSAADGESPSGWMGVGLGFGSYTSSGVTTRAITVPLSYSYRSPLDPRHMLSLDMPITFSDIDGAKAYAASLGLSYRFPVADFWTLTPNASYGLVYSGDLGSSGQMIGAGLTSALYFNVEPFEVTIGNMAGYYASIKTSIGGYESNPELRNWIFRNGVMLSHQISLAGTKTVDLYLVDTRYTGSSLYNQYTDEIGIAIGTNRSAFSARSYVRGSIGYLVGQETRGWSARIGYWF